MLRLERRRWCLAVAVVLIQKTHAFFFSHKLSSFINAVSRSRNRLVCVIVCNNPTALTEISSDFNDDVDHQDVNHANNALLQENSPELPSKNGESNDENDQSFSVYDIPSDPEQEWEFFYQQLQRKNHSPFMEGLLRSWIANQRKSLMKTLGVLNLGGKVNRMVPPLTLEQKLRLDQAGFDWGHLGLHSIPDEVLFSPEFQRELHQRNNGQQRRRHRRRQKRSKQRLKEKRDDSEDENKNEDE